MNTSATLRAIAGTAALVLAVPCALGAQQDVMRDVYGFYGSSLDVEVATENAGRIRLIRGQRSRIEVAGRAPDGFTSAALGGGGVRRLTLTALASGPVDFVVSVPEDVRVRVHWEGHNRSELFGTLTRTATYAWESAAPRPAFETLGPAATRASASAGIGETAPSVLDFVGAYHADRLTVRIGASAFGVTPERAIDATRSSGTLRITPREGSAVTVDVPAGERMTLRLDGVDAVVIDDDGVRVLCESVLSQTLPDGQQWLTLTPVPRDGCRATTPRRAPPATTPARRT